MYTSPADVVRGGVGEMLFNNVTRCRHDTHDTPYK